jgi:hypothetical protein
MAMRSVFKEDIKLNEPYEILQNCMTYAYFFDETHPATGHPYVYTKDNFEMLNNRPEFFARKFDCCVDEDIMDMIDKNIVCQPEKPCTESAVIVILRQFVNYFEPGFFKDIINFNAGVFQKVVKISV